MNTMTVTFEFAAEDRARIDKLIEQLRARCDKCSDTALAMIEEYRDSACVTNKTSPNIDFDQPGNKHTAQAPETENGAQISRDDVRCKVVTLSRAGYKAEVARIVKAVAKNVTEIPDEQLSFVMQQLNALEASL